MNWTMKRLLHGTLRLRDSPTGEQIRNGRPTDEKPNNSLMWPTTVVSFFFPYRNFCAENFVIFFYEIKATLVSSENDLRTFNSSRLAVFADSL